MATTPEEFFMNRLVEKSPPSPSVFLDLSPVPNSGKEGCLPPKDVTIPCISRMLMEDDMDNMLPSDDPALLQVQQPFAQILSTPSFSRNNGNSFNGANAEGTNNLFCNGSGDQIKFESAYSSGADAVKAAFLKGMEEAKMFLLEENGLTRGELLVNEIFRESKKRGGLRKRCNRDEHYLVEDKEVSSSSKLVVTKELDKVGACETMFDKMLLLGCETFIRDIEKLRITVSKEGKNNKTKGGSKAARNVLDLPALLIRCAQAVAGNNHMVAAELLKQILQHASATGDSTQRLAKCFAKGLESRLVGAGSQLQKLHMAERLSNVELLKAYNFYMTACCFDKVALLFSVMVIMDAIAVAGKSGLHVVDYGLHYGFQWAALLRLLANRDGGPPEVKITAIRHPQPRSCPAEQIEENGHRLSKCAREFGVRFSFQAIMANWEEVCNEDLNTGADEVLVLSDHFNFSSLTDESVFFDKPNPRDTVLKNIRKMRPDVYIQSIVNCANRPSFLSRFQEAWSYYMTLFNAFDATMPRDSESRLVLEQRLFGLPALNLIACNGVEMVGRPETYRQWQVRNQRAGLKQLPLKPDIVKVLKDTVKKQYHKDFLICEDDQWLLQVWKGRILFAHSTWTADGCSSE